MLGRVAKVALGVLLTLAGVAMLVLPGPGILVTALGIGLVLAQTTGGRRVIGRLRLRARHRFGSRRVREVERRLPREIVGTADTTALEREHLAEELERRRRAAERRRRRD